MAGQDFSLQVLGKSDEVIRTDTLTELIAAIDRMTAQATRSLRILAHDTQPEIYGRESFANLLTDFIARRHKVAKIQVLVADPQRAVRDSHRLVELWHRFPSFVDFRQLSDEYNRTREDFLLVDDIGLIRRPDPDSPMAITTFRNLNTGSDRAAWFDEAWSRGIPCVALRRLSL